MKIFLKRAVQVAFFCVVVYGGYRAYEAWWSTGSVQHLQAQVGGFLQQSGGEVRQVATDKAGEYAQGVVSEAGSTTRAFVAGKAADALSYVGQQILAAASTLGGASPATGVSPAASGEEKNGPEKAPNDVTFAVPPPAATISVKTGVPLTLSLNRPDAFTIDWGDGSQDSGSVLQGQVLLIRHIWETQGDFQVRVTFQGSDGVSSSFFPVRIYNQ